MGDRQCGLCLSCGVPMLPKPEDIDTYAVDRGFLSLLHLNNEFRIASSMAKFNNPHFTSIENKAHVIHTAHHQDAVRFMMNTHQGDRSVREVQDTRPARTAFTFYKKFSTKKQPQIAWWDRPTKEQRIKYRSLRSFITGTVSAVARGDRGWFDDHPDTESTNETYKACRDCNAVMTREARFNELLRDVNEQGLFPDQALIHVVNAKVAARATPEEWTRDGGERLQDGMAPRVAYYLHLCMPYVSNPDQDWFQNVDASPETRRTMRRFYVQQSWLVLQVACLCGTIERSEVEGSTALTAGTKAYTGSLDFYVSYFCWRLFLFEHGDTMHRALDFAQWHQKYMWHAHGCPGLDLPRKQTIGAAVEPGGSPAAKGLVEAVQRRLVRLYRRTLRPLTDFLRGVGHPRPEIGQYFVHPSKLRSLIRASSRCGKLNFDDALRNVGVVALTAHVLELCDGYPDDVREQLRDFRHHWRLREVGNIAFNNPGVDPRTAGIWHDLAHTLDPPREIPEDKGRLRSLLRGPKSSPWVAVAALRHMRAFRERRAKDE